MDRKLLARILAGILVLMMLLSLIPMLASAEAKTFVVEVSLMDDKPKGTWKNGDTFKCGTDSYFTVFCSETTRIDGSSKSFADGYSSEKRLNFNSDSVFGDQILNAVQFKTTSAAKVTVWFVSGGDGREVAIFDQAGNVLQRSGPGAIKNLPYIAEFDLPEANTYYIANIGGNNNSVKIEVTVDGNGIRSYYGHCSSLVKSIGKGTKVYQGQVIAYVGSTGNSTGNHIHFALYNIEKKEYFDALPHIS